jgi:Flp pilus assembly protein TadG
MSAFFTAITRLFHDKSGNVAFIFALICIPVVSVVGCAVDYSMATRMRVKLQAAADAASVASISQKSPGFIQAAAMTGNGTVSVGITDADNVFDGNMSAITGYSNLTRSSVVTKTGIQLSSTVQFSAQVPVTFMKVLGYQNLTIGGTSTSSASLPPYLDFYLALDVSGSMGLPSTAAEQARLAAVNPDNYVQYPTGCTLACHFSPQNSACTDSGTQGYPTNNYCLGYVISRLSQSGYTNLLQTKTSNPKRQQLPSSIVNGVSPYTINPGLPNSLTAPIPYGGGGLNAVSSCPTAGTDACIQLRLDAVGFALNATQSANGTDGLFAVAQKSESVTNQFRIGLYPFIESLYAYFPLTSSINGSPTNSSTINYAAANLATLLDTNVNSNLGSGGTHIDVAMNSMNATITSVGDGSSPTSTQPYVFLITDGAQDPQMKGVPNGGWSGSNHATVLNDPSNSYPNICQTIKNRNIIISVLYIPYQPISPVNSSFANDEDDAANNNIPNIPPSLQACASPGFFYTANAPADITAALNQMFSHALSVARITN